MTKLINGNARKLKMSKRLLKDEVSKKVQCKRANYKRLS